MKKSKRGFVVSAVLYPLLVLFLAIIMGLLSMTDTRKRILDKMKLEIEDSILDDATCSCETILAKLNYIIDKLDKGITTSNGGGQYAFNRVSLNINIIETESELPTSGNVVGDISVVSNVPLNGYYVSPTAPTSPQDGMVWIAQDFESKYYILSDWNKIGITHVMQWHDGKWNLKKAFIYEVGDKTNRWTMLYYIKLNDTYVDLSSVDINAQTEWTYDYTGKYQVFKPIFSGYYDIELWGAQGGTYSTDSGGLGAYTKGRIYLDANTTLYVYVGGTTSNVNAGWNGGGKGSSVASGLGAGGGGATDIRLVKGDNDSSWDEFDSLKSRIMVAAGGGGSGRYDGSNRANGGAGGAFIGYQGVIVSGSQDYGSGRGGTQGSGGASFYDATASEKTPGGFGYGGKSASVGWSSAGGGGGYYGGGGGSYIGNGGGGGSSYISGHEGFMAIDNESTRNEDNKEEAMIFTGKSIHYSRKYFTNTRMVDGQGYEWTTKQSDVVKYMPNKSGSGTVKGNSGNGYAKISLVAVTTLTHEQQLSKSKNEEDSQGYNYTYSGNYQTFVVPKSGIYKIEAWGAQGGNWLEAGGLGAYTSGKIWLEKNSKLYLYIGARPYGLKGGWNGGGDGYSISSGSGSGGGGATDIRLINTEYPYLWNEFESLKTRIMVAAGGGGGGRYDSNNRANGGAGGGLNGYSGVRVAGGNDAGVGSGAGQSKPGFSQYDTSAISLSEGTFGKGGNATNASWSHSGGGGGYYGGGGGSQVSSPGGGGSSYISGHLGCRSISEESISNGIIHIGSGYHYSGNYFYATSMIDGQGYDWTTAKGDLIGMPSVYASNEKQNGQSGDGYVRIKFIEELDVKSEEDNNSYFDYEFLEKHQEFTAPYDGTYKVELWGAQGGTHNEAGGLGTYASGEIYLDKNSKLYIYVGGQPINLGTKINRIGGWNGGGDGSSVASGIGAGGGGATDIRLVKSSSLTSWDGFGSLKSRIMVAAGGGGGARYDSNNRSYGGAGGAFIGYQGVIAAGSQDYGSGRGGTQGSGGASFYSANASLKTPGGFGYGGKSVNENWSSAGGGGGYYGGGGGSYVGNGGGGGSSYISGHEGFMAIDKSSVENNIQLSGKSIHYSDYYFNKTKIVDGTGYEWTTKKLADPVYMPNQTGNGTMTGNSGNGYAKITLVERKSLSSSQKESNLNAKLEKEKYRYTYTGYYQTFIVPKTGTYKIDLWGAQGGNWLEAGGLGAYTSGRITLTQGTKLYVYVGNRPYGLKGGWNGGGGGYSISSGSGSGGGGATDIRTVAGTDAIAPTTVWNTLDSLKTRIMVAAGGGGGGRYDSNNRANGGAGGGLNGYSGVRVAGGNDAGVGTAGSQINAGFSSYDTAAMTLTKGGFGFGGNATNASWSHSGGGAGWYGGGGGSQVSSPGGGGSSYISGHDGCIAVTSSGTPKVTTWSTSNDSVSYTNYKFTRTLMIDGAGYEWTTVKAPTQTLDLMPSVYNANGIQTGQSGDGYALIEYLGA